MVERTHFLEVGGDEVPSRGASAGATVTPAVADEVPLPFSESEFEGDIRASFVGVDFYGDREDSGWMSIGERLAQIFWLVLGIVGIILLIVLRFVVF